ncbi:MAG: prephenate dehydratase [Candidatus Omnitrophica bacterium]|nr:prephenate dehydratase [Candidatus Omnitrophota bacterium]
MKTRKGQTLQDLRNKVDALNRRLVELLNERARLTLQIRDVKERHGISRYAADREKIVYKKVSVYNKGPLSDEAVKACFREIMSGALALEQPLKVAYMGPELTFSHMAAEERFGSQVAYVCCDTIGDVFREVERGRVDFGVVPIENSIEGAVNHTLDVLVDSELKICSEISMSISHSLLAKNKIPLARLTKIWSNPQVFAQCRHWLEDNVPRVRLVEVVSTAHAATLVRQSTGRGVAAIAGRRAAKRYGLAILADGIEDSGVNTTRFLVIGTSQGNPTGNDKTSLVFSVKDKVGALHDMLAPFKRYRINMTKIESRPSKRKAWDYYFFVDLEGHFQDQKVKQALKELERQCAFLKILGSYPSAT